MIRSRFSLLIALVSVLIFFIALLVPVEYIPLDTRYDKQQHAIFFCGITLLFYACLRIRLWVLVLAMMTVAIVSELSQMLAPKRSSNWQDLQADFIGIGAAAVLIVLCVFVMRFKSRRKPK